LGEAIIQAGKRAKQSRSLGAFTGLLRNVGTLAKMPGEFRLLGQAQDAVALRLCARFAETFGSQSATLYRIGGDAVVATA
jgi:hypothetical protein